MKLSTCGIACIVALCAVHTDAQTGAAEEKFIPAPGFVDVNAEACASDAKHSCLTKEACEAPAVGGQWHDPAGDDLGSTFVGVLHAKFDGVRSGFALGDDRAICTDLCTEDARYGCFTKAACETVGGGKWDERGVDTNNGLGYCNDDCTKDTLHGCQTQSACEDKAIGGQWDAGYHQTEHEPGHCVTACSMEHLYACLNQEVCEEHQGEWNFGVHQCNEPSTRVDHQDL